jgi:type VII secretion integral membrane protein EccD
MTDAYSRVTLVGRDRRVDAVLPSDEALGTLVPELLRLVGDRVESPARVRQVVTLTGDVLPEDLTLREADVLDGTVLRLVAREDAPPIPVVHDVTEEVAEDTDARTHRWGPAARRWSATLALVVLAGLAANLTGRIWPSGTGALVVTVVAILLAATGVAVATRVSEPLGSALTLAAGAMAVAGAWAAADAGGWPVAARWGAAAMAAAITLVLLGFTSPLGQGGMTGGTAVLVLVIAWTAGSLIGFDPVELGAAVGVVTTVLLGVLPRLALSASGLTTLDDRRSGGHLVRRGDVRAALDRAHLSLVLAVMGGAASAALAGVLLAAAPSRWTVPLTLLLVAVLISRAGSFPLAGEVIALLAAAAVIVVALVMCWAARTDGAPVGPLLVVLVLAGLSGAALVVRPPEHIRTWLRRTSDTIEAAAVVLSVPLAIGVFGVYGELLDVFRG